MLTSEHREMEEQPHQAGGIPRTQEATVVYARYRSQIWQLECPESSLGSSGPSHARHHGADTRHLTLQEARQTRNTLLVQRPRQRLKVEFYDAITCPSVPIKIGDRVKIMALSPVKYHYREEEARNPRAYLVWSGPFLAVYD